MAVAQSGASREGLGGELNQIYLANIIIASSGTPPGLLQVL